MVRFAPIILAVFVILVRIALQLEQPGAPTHRNPVDPGQVGVQLDGQ
ncbi:hypothetical protein ACFXPZ_26320 [Streptomyces sp. NPDC059101]